jgi:hypothetical protein
MKYLMLIRRTKYELITKLIAEVMANSQDRSINLINLSLAHVHCSTTLSNH